jgi:hypothetical protein
MLVRIPSPAVVRVSEPNYSVGPRLTHHIVDDIVDGHLRNDFTEYEIQAHAYFLKQTSY